MVDVHISNTDDLLDVVEAICGYTPDEQITVVVEKADGDGAAILVMNIKEEGHIQLAVDAMLESDGATVAIIGWCERDTAYMASALAAYGLLSDLNVATIRATKTEWWHADEQERHTRVQSMAKMDLIMEGVPVVVAADREAMLSHQLLMEPRWGELTSKFPPVLPAEGGQWVVDRLKQRVPLDADHTAMIIGAVKAGFVRDHIADALARARLELNWHDIDSMRARLVETVAEAPDGERGFLYRAVGIAFELMGNPEVASKAMELAEDDDNDTPLTDAFLALIHDHTPEGFAHILVQACERSRGEGYEIDE